MTKRRSKLWQLISKYENYIESNINWFGRIPSCWKFVKLKNLISQHFGGCWGNDCADEKSIEESICIRIADFDFNNQQPKNVPFTKRFYSSKQVNSTKLIDGDIILEKSGGGDKTPVGRTILFSQKQFGDNSVLFANFCECLRPKNINNKYYSDRKNTSNIWNQI